MSILSNTKTTRKKIQYMKRHVSCWVLFCFCSCSCFCFRRLHYVAQADLEISIFLLLHPLECWDYKHAHHTQLAFL